MIFELLPALIGVGSLLNQRCPSLIGVKPRGGGMRLAITGDGNCTGTSWMMCSLVWAAQVPRRLKYAVDWLKTAKRGGAFSKLSRSERAISPSIQCTYKLYYLCCRLSSPASGIPRSSFYRCREKLSYLHPFVLGAARRRSLSAM